MSKSTLLASTALAFIGLGPAAAKKGKGKPGETNVKDDEKPGETNVEDPDETEDVTGAQAARADSYEDGDEPDEDDEPDDDDEDEDDEDTRKKRAAARRHRNALRAAGHRRGVKAERSRLASIMNGLAPGKVELALHLALNTNLSPDQVTATLKAAPEGKKGGLAEAMARVSGSTTDTGFAATGSGKGPTLSGLMQAEIDRAAAKKKAARAAV